jgi:hypothetical protein
MTDEKHKTTFVLQTHVNSFHYLYQDAEYLHQMAKKPEMAKIFERVQLCRTALLLYTFSLEGLINRSLDHFLPQHLHEFILEREDKFGVEDKWLLLPLLISQKESFDKSRYPWSQFAELIKIRNDFVHPKHERSAYYRAITSHEWEPLPWDEIPEDLNVKETEVIYRQTRIPKDPYAIRPEHLDTVKKVVDDTIIELDRFLGGKITQNNWLHNDEMKLIYPPNANLNDLTSLPPKQKAE